jgi:hypothetical protein
VTTDISSFVPELRTDYARRDVDGESVVWSPIAPEPVALDPVATVMLDVIDGKASIGELANDVHEAVGIPLARARQQVARVVELIGRAGLLTSSTGNATAEEAIEARDLFVATTTPCSENASRLGTVTLNLRFGTRVVRIACDSRRGARTVRDALADHIVDIAAPEEAPLGFVLTAPHGLKRKHSLTDRSGFVLSQSRGLDAGLRALASHLTALLPPNPGTVRFRARAVVAGDVTSVCLFPVLYFPPVPDGELARSGVCLIDRLALDVEVPTGRIVNPDVPWAALANREAGLAHLGTGGIRTASAVVTDPGSRGSGAPTRAFLAASLAATGLNGSPADLVDAAVRLVERAALRTTPRDASPLPALLGTQ